MKNQRASAAIFILAIFNLILIAPADAEPIGPSAFGGGAVVESFEGQTAGPNIPPPEGFIPGVGILVPGAVGPFQFPSGATMTQPIPNEPLDMPPVILQDFSLGIGGFGVTPNGTITSADDVPFGTAFLGIDAGSLVEFTFSTDMLRVGAYVTGSSDVTITTFDAVGALLETLSIPSVPVSSWGTNFLGMENPAGIRRVIFEPSVVVIDGLTFEAIPQPLTVLLDVRPGNDINLVNPMSRGVIPVAILGSDTFDVADVDVTTLAFGPNGARLAHQNGPQVKDANNDGLDDLLAHFLTQESGIAFGDEEACVTGETLDGTPFEGCDTIATEPPCGRGYEAALLVPPLVWARRRWQLRASAQALKR